MGFSQQWSKLQKPTFTTFRFKRRDADWVVGEVVQIVFKPRSRKREVMGVAEIVGKEPRQIPRHGRCDFEAPLVTNEEANTDGFPDTVDKYFAPQIRPGYFGMWEFLFNAYGPRRLFEEPMYKLTLRWVTRQEVRP